MPQKKLTLSLSENDLALIQQAKGNLSLASFLLRCTLKIIAQEIHLIHYAPDRHERNKATVLRLLRNGCCEAAEIERQTLALSQAEIEMYLFELEQESIIERRPGKRGQMWRWDVI